MTTMPDNALLLARTSLDEPTVMPFANGELVLFTAPSPEPDRVNEDAVLALPLGDGCGVVALADGAGGMADGALAARTALAEVRRSIGEAADDGLSLRDGILHGIDRANEAVRLLRGAGTTVVIVRISRRELRSYHVGDSRALVTGGRGRVKLLTMDHSPVGYAVESGILDSGDAIFHEDRHLVSNLLGSPDMRIEIGAPLRLAARDTLVIASDGLHDNLRTSEIVECVRKGRLADAADRLIQVSRDRMTGDDPDAPSKPDDVTFVLFRPGRAG